MSKLTKQDIINQISESSKDIDEMAITPKQSQIYGRDEKKPQDYHYDKPEIPFEKGDLDAEDYELVKMRHAYQPDPKISASDKVNQKMIEDYIVIQLERGGERHVVVPKFRTNGEIWDENNLKEHNPDLFNYIMEVTQGRVHFIEMKQVANNPFQKRTGRTNKVLDKVEKELGIKFPDNKERPQTGKEILLRKVINPGFKFLANNVNSHLNKAGFPGLVMPDHVAELQKKNIDKYSTIDDNTIKWASANLRYYPTVDAFIQHSKDLVRGRKSEITPIETHQPRKYNPGTNWSPLRKTIKKDENYKEDPFTDVYKLNKRGYSVEDMDLVIQSEFIVTGRRLMAENNQPYFVWNFEFHTFRGKKLREEQNAKELVSDISLNSQSQSFRVGDKPLDELVKDQDFINAFNEGLNDLIVQIQAINAKEELRSRYKNIDRLDITREIQEMVVDKIVKNVIAELNI